ncbi:Cysteine synthase [bioreactor metagenome]|uniref:cysteine synthase n=1 Tax=bioreactor metagenome TaxID=1076179 RepID=A0A645BWR2_9ZZZZ|nr:cysteine synthase A [Oscillospiraceae bacterium]
MNGIYKNFGELVGNTPAIEFSRVSELYGLSARLIAKLEYFNPAGSIKDRVALYMIENAERKGLLKPGAVIIEPTSGNTGIGLAAVAAYKGYRIIITMPSSMSIERRKLLKAYGAELVLTDASLGMKGAIQEAQRLSSEISGSFIPGQFTNPDNPEAHYRTTGPELWTQTGGNIDILVAGAGTGGTVTGTGRFLKEKNSDIKIIAAEPASSPVISGGKPGPHKLQGIGAGFIPDILDMSVLDEVIKVTNEAAYDAVRMLAKTEGIFVGISSGAALSAAISVAGRPTSSGKTIAVILPDAGDRYLSTDLID